MMRLSVLWIVLVAAICGLLATSVSGTGTGHFSILGAGTPPTPPFNSVTFGTFGFYGNGSCPAAKCVMGDTWFNTWGDDDKIYTQSCDSSRWNGSSQTVPGSSNVDISTLSDATVNMTGTSVNTMDAWGTASQAGSDSATYKGYGLIMVHGTLYLSAVRQATSLTNWFSAQIVKSTDHGVTITPAPPSTAQPYASPMFTDSHFRVPTFVQYGKNYTGQTADNSANYVYAVSPDVTSGHTNPNGFSDRIFLARVAVANIGNQSISDWSYYQGGDGMLDANWGSISTASPTLAATPGNFIFEVGPIMTYIGSGQYLLITVSYAQPTPNPANSTWSFWRGSHPWGPWTFIQSNSWNSSNPQGPNNAYGFYFPIPIVKSIASHADGTTTMTLLSTGDFNTSSTFYTLYITPTTLHP